MKRKAINGTGISNEYRILLRSKILSALQVIYAALWIITIIQLSGRISLMSDLEIRNVDSLSPKTVLYGYGTEAVLEIPLYCLVVVALFAILIYYIIQYDEIKISDDQLIFMSSIKYGLIMLDSYDIKHKLIIRNDDRYHIVSQQHKWRNWMCFTNQKESYQVLVEISYTVDLQEITEQGAMIFMPQASHRKAILEYIGKNVSFTPDEYLIFQENALQNNPFGLCDMQVEALTVTKEIPINS